MKKKKKKNKYVIFDWAGNRLSKHGTFKSFDDAWEYIYKKFPEEDHQDLHVDTSEKKSWELA